MVKVHVTVKNCCVALAVFIAIFHTTAAGRDKDTYCNACQVVAEEINNDIKRVDPKRTLQVGSFRINPDGTQDLKEIPYARSDTHLTEIIETVCGRLHHYAETRDSKGRKTYIDTHNPMGAPISTEGATRSRQVTAELQHACDTVLNEYDEEVLEVFKDVSLTEPEKTLCVEKLGLCEEDAFMGRIWAQAQAAMKGMREFQQKQEDKKEEESEKENEEGENGESGENGQKKGEDGEMEDENEVETDAKDEL